MELLRDVCLAASLQGAPVTLVPLGPLTNVALLLRTCPAAARGIARIVFMGGAAAVGNATASAELNVLADPEAAAIVLAAATIVDRRDAPHDTVHDAQGQPPSRIAVALAVDGPRYAALWPQALLGQAR